MSTSQRAAMFAALFVGIAGGTFASSCHGFINRMCADVEFGAIPTLTYGLGAELSATLGYESVTVHVSDDSVDITGTIGGATSAVSYGRGG